MPEQVGGFTLCVPFYRNVGMLREQILSWNAARVEGVKVILIDDGSPEPALPVVEEFASEQTKARLQVYRITKDIPWNRGGARNLAAKVAATRWLVHVDIDHVLTPDSYEPLMGFVADPHRFYRFPRWRVGKADETRRKDKIPTECEFGRIHEHVDSYLITRELYWLSGGYNEVYSGCLGGGGAFLHRMERAFAGPALMLPETMRLHVYTRHQIRDASDWALSRDPSEYAHRKRMHPEMANPIPSLNFPWERVL